RLFDAAPQAVAGREVDLAADLDDRSAVVHDADVDDVVGGRRAGLGAGRQGVVVPRVGCRGRAAGIRVGCRGRAAGTRVWLLGHDPMVTGPGGAVTRLAQAGVGVLPGASAATNASMAASVARASSRRPAMSAATTGSSVS